MRSEIPNSKKKSIWTLKGIVTLSPLQIKDTRRTNVLHGAKEWILYIKAITVFMIIIRKIIKTNQKNHVILTGNQCWHP